MRWHIKPGVHNYEAVPANQFAIATARQPGVDVIYQTTFGAEGNGTEGQQANDEFDQVPANSQLKPGGSGSVTAAKP